jgi:hypothetical protein
MLNDGMDLDYVTDDEVTGVIYAGNFPSILRQQSALHGNSAPPVLRERMDLYQGQSRAYIRDCPP